MDLAYNISTKIKTALEEEIVELIWLSTTKDVGNAGFGAPRI